MWITAKELMQRSARSHLQRRETWPRSPILNPSAFRRRIQFSRNRRLRPLPPIRRTKHLAASHPASFPTGQIMISRTAQFQSCPQTD